MTSVNRSGDSIGEFMAQMTVISSEANKAKEHAQNHKGVNTVFKELGEVYQKFQETALDERALLGSTEIKLLDDPTREVIIDKIHKFKSSFLGAYSLIKDDLSDMQKLSSKVWESQINKKCNTIIEATVKKPEAPQLPPRPQVFQNSNVKAVDQPKEKKPLVPKKPPPLPNTPPPSIKSPPPLPSKPPPSNNNNANIQDVRGNRPPNKPAPKVPKNNDNRNL
jgi:hypothetical protein